MSDLAAAVRAAVLHEFTRYECEIEQDADFVAVHGAPGTCPLRVDIVRGYVNLDAGTRSELVLEYELSKVEDVELIRSVVARLMQWDQVQPLSKAGLGELGDYGPYPQGPVVALVGRLNAETAPTAQGGSRWYASTVRAVLQSQAAQPPESR